MRVARSKEFVHQRFNDKIVTFLVEVSEPLYGQIDGDIYRCASRDSKHELNQ